MAKSIHVFMLILILHALESALANRSSSLSHANECSLLFQFKENMSIDKYASFDTRANSKVASWNLNRSDGPRNCCSWDGVECRFGHVIGLDLSSSLLSGPISSNNSLFNLIHLRTLNLADNNFSSSEIPSGIGRLSQLANLNLSYSWFSGEVPKQISQLRSLVSLDLTGNELAMQSFDFQNLVQNSSETIRELYLSEVMFDLELPASIGNLTHFNILDLSSCNFTGTIPASVSDLTQLKFLDLSDNSFSGPLPTLVNSSLLTSLVLRDCGLGGDFPTGIFNLQTLQLLEVKDNNNLTGYIPEFHGKSELKHLVVAGTKFQGSIPASIGNLTHLNILDLSSCNFTGTLPASVSNLTQLTFLDLSYNKFTGSFDRWKLPDWLGKLKKITYLSLNDVNLFGEIPSTFFNLTQVEELYLSGNKLKGELPNLLLNFQNLKSFYIYDNNVTVDSYLFLSLKKLEHLDLSGNNITISVLDSHTNETQPKFTTLRLSSCNLRVFPEFLRFQHQLQYLFLDNNDIEGLIPRWMWNISKETLITLSLAQNLLTGFEQHSLVSPWVWLDTLDLSHNMLIGEISPSICDLLSLRSLDLSFNNINGSISPCLEKLSTSLIALNLRSNSLQGTIPNIFTNESTLKMIDLSENKLEGQVPRSLENCDLLQILDLGYNFIEDTFPFWLGALSELQVLILRFNKFHGIIRIPSPIEVNFIKLRIIDLSYNSFSGDLPHQLFQEWPAMKEIEAPLTSAHIKCKATSMKESEAPITNGHITFKAVTNGHITFKALTNEHITFNALRHRVEDYRFLIQITNKGLKMDYVKILDAFFAIDLSNNMFRGMIPESIKTLSGLKLLNLSNNKLSGVIPPSMGNLTSLEALDLSGNKLSGLIPQDLVQLNFLEFLNVSNNNLTGPIPKGNQFYTFSNNSYIGNQELCGFPLSMRCGDSEESKPPKVSPEEDTNSDFPNGIDWVIILIGVVCGLVIGVVCGDYLITKYYKWFSQKLRT